MVICQIAFMIFFIRDLGMLRVLSASMLMLCIVPLTMVVMVMHGQTSNLLLLWHLLMRCFCVLLFALLVQRIYHVWR